MDLGVTGAGCFGFVVGWLTYYVNRHRRDEVHLGDLITLVGVIGGATVVGLFGRGTEQFGAYGLGLFLGFLSYFFVLVYCTMKSKGDFTAAWFLDGRRKDPGAGWGGSPVGEPPMLARKDPDR